MHSSQTKRSYHASRLRVAQLKGTLLTASLQWRIWKQNLELLKPWSLLRALLGCCWEMSCSAPPPTLSLLAGDHSRAMPIHSGDYSSAETLFSQQEAAILDSKASPGQCCSVCQSTNALFTSQSGKNTLMGVTSEDYQLPSSTPLPDTWGSTGGKVAKPAYSSSQLYRNHFFWEVRLRHTFI